VSEGISREEAANIALAAGKESSRQTLNEVFGLMGVNLASADSIEAFRNDMIWLRRTRKMSDSISSKFALAFVGIIAVAIGISIWEGMKALLHQ
jgi:hypothetical protein